MNDFLDRVVIFFVLFMAAEFFWLFSYIKRKLVFIILLAGMGTLYFVKNIEWITTPPGRIHHYWTYSLADTHSYKGKTYFIKERDRGFKKIPHRTFELGKYPGGIRFFEKHIDYYSTSEGYYNTDFIFQWRHTPKGVRVDIIDDTTVVWTLGEGFKETAGVD
ncbi:MAG: hypothetical protein GF401_17145 [Chitinivibrionales bacterium]|nr:hypothetical protein [Chitinivibrionales bacterium]